MNRQASSMETAGRGRPVSPVDIVVPVYNQAEMTQQFLNSLRAYTDYPFRLILVDNGSEDLPESLIHDFPGGRLIKSPKNLGFAGGCNLGLRASQSPLVAVCNNDLIMTQGWLGRMVRSLLSHDSIAAAAPCTNYSAGFQQVEIGLFNNMQEMHAQAGSFCASHEGQMEDVSFVTGMCLLMRREVLDRIGLFDERFGIGNYEDNDLCARIKEIGLRIVVCRDAYLYHLGSRTFQALNVSYGKLIETNRQLFYEKWRDNDFIHGRELEEKGDLKGALDHYLAALKSNPKNPEPLLQLGAMLLALQRPEAAENAFKQYLQRCPESIRARIGLSSALCLGGRSQEGIAMIDAVLASRYLRAEEKETIQQLIYRPALNPTGI